MPNGKCELLDVREWVSMPMVAQGQANPDSEAPAGTRDPPHSRQPRVSLKLRSSIPRSTGHTIVARRLVEAGARQRASQQLPSSAPVPGRERLSRAALQNLKNERATAGAGYRQQPQAP